MCDPLIDASGIYEEKEVSGPARPLETEIAIENY